MNVPVAATSPLRIDLGIHGMTCASCVARAERALKKVPGVQEVAVNLATESARILVTPSDQVEARLKRAVRDAATSRSRPTPPLMRRLNQPGPVLARSLWARRCRSL